MPALYQRSRAPAGRVKPRCRSPGMPSRSRVSVLDRAGQELAGVRRGQHPHHLAVRRLAHAPPAGGCGGAGGGGNDDGDAGPLRQAQRLMQQRQAHQRADHRLQAGSARRRSSPAAGSAPPCRARTARRCMNTPMARPASSTGGANKAAPACISPTGRMTRAAINVPSAAVGPPIARPACLPSRMYSAQPATRRRVRTASPPGRAGARAGSAGDSSRMPDAASANPQEIQPPPRGQYRGQQRAGELDGDGDAERQRADRQVESKGSSRRGRRRSRAAWAGCVS